MAGRLVHIAAIVGLLPAAAEAQTDSDAPDDEGRSEERSLDAGEFEEIAGTGGDPLRGLEILPGVWPDAGGGLLPVLRGHGEPDVRYHLLGLDLPLPFHIAGQRSVLAPDWVERVELHPVPPVRYGDVGGPVVDVELRAPGEPGARATAAIDTIAATAGGETLFERGPARGTAVGVALRRSLVDLWGPTGAGSEAPATLVDAPVYGRLLPESSQPVFEDAPVFWDYLLLADTSLGGDDDVDVVLHGSVDSVALSLGDAADVDPALAGVARSSASQHAAIVRWRHRVSEDATNELTVSARTLSRVLTLGSPIDVGYSRADVVLRNEHAQRVDAFLSIEVGGEVAARRTELRLEGPPPPEEGSVPRPVAVGPALRGDAEWVSLEPAGWVATPMRITRDWRLVPGVRATYHGLVERASFDPRVSSLALLGPDTTARGAIGLCTRGPDAQFVMSSVGTEGLDPQRVAQVALGADQRIDVFVASLDGYLHVISDRAVQVPDDGARGYHYAPIGGGSVRGVEVSLRLPPSTTGWARVSYGLSASEREDAAGPLRPFSGDRTHGFTAAGGWSLDGGWVLGARFRAASGLPVTEVVDVVYDADADAYRPIEGPRGAVRLPAFTQLDLRASKRWDVAGGSISAYVDVQNVYAAENAVGRVCSFDYSQCADVRGVPFLPTVGLEGSL